MERRVLVVGAGVGGASTAMWLRSLGVSFDWIEASSRLGGTLHQVYNPINHLIGRDYSGGAELVDQLGRQLEGQSLWPTLNTILHRAEFATGAATLRAELLATDGTLRTAIYDALVVATGTRRRLLGVPGEEEASGRGVALSGRRDLEAFTGKRVVIVGSGDAAFENATLIAPLAESVTLVCRTCSHRARRQFQQRAASHSNVRILTETVLTEIEPDPEAPRLRSVTLEAAGAAMKLEADVALIRVGVQARVPDLSIDGESVHTAADGFLIADVQRRAGHPRLFAVGDCARPTLRTLSLAEADGAVAAHVIAERFW